METEWFPQRGMGVLLTEEQTAYTGQAKLQASSLVPEQGRLALQGDPPTLGCHSGGGETSMRESVDVKGAVILLPTRSIGIQTREGGVSDLMLDNTEAGFFCLRD